VAKLRALVKTESGLEYTRCEVPQPGPGAVLVKVMCAGLCRSDLYLSEGLLEVETPRILGHECSGVICRLGEGVEQERLGRRVAVFPWIGCSHCDYCLQDEEHLGHLCPQRQFLGQHLDGCFADFMAIRADRCINISEEISFQAGAYLEPLVAALGVMRSPLREAKQVAVLGHNRIAGLTSTVLREYAQCRHDGLTIGHAEDNSYDLIIETGASNESIRDALRCLRPDGVLVLKSRPALDVEWPVRMQVEKEITTMALGYGSLKLAMMLLEKRSEIFQKLWSEPVPLSAWRECFQQAKDGREESKTFFLPQVG
jgi:L-iditol 2-dehydrogenase